MTKPFRSYNRGRRRSRLWCWLIFILAWCRSGHDHIFSLGLHSVRVSSEINSERVASRFWDPADHVFRLGEDELTQQRRKFLPLPLLLLLSLVKSCLRLVRFPHENDVICLLSVVGCLNIWGFFTLVDWPRLRPQILADRICDKN